MADLCTTLLYKATMISIVNRIVCQAIRGPASVATTVSGCTVNFVLSCIECYEPLITSYIHQRQSSVLNCLASYIYCAFSEFGLSHCHCHWHATLRAQAVLAMMSEGLPPQRFTLATLVISCTHNLLSFTKSLQIANDH